ncbi:MAG: hypothetical protein M0Z84_03615 [Gammaproteobacteria bacterium]|nr:hypothetical protein [Gammaproteobacteria bacterium]
MKLGHDEICALIPHAGSMCLLEGVESWDQEKILCYAVSHTVASNPLRRPDGLHVVCGVEYAAQGMALHARLSGAGHPPGAGLLASVRDLKLFAECLDGCGERLWIEARRLTGSAQGFIYDFEVRTAGAALLLSGRAAIMAAEAGGP